MHEYDKEKDILKGVELAEKVLTQKNKVDWQDEREVSIMRSEDHRNKRKKQLDKYIPERVCPHCKCRILIDSFWVIKNGKYSCRSCWSTEQKFPSTKNNKICTEIEMRFRIDGWKILLLREESGCGVKQFAYKMGWSPVYQGKIERGEVRTVSYRTFKKLSEVFESIGQTVDNPHIS